MKTPDQNDLKLGTIVVLDAVSKPIDFGFKRSRVGRRVYCIFQTVAEPTMSLYNYPCLVCSVMSSRATLLFKLVWICIST